MAGGVGLGSWLDDDLLLVRLVGTLLLEPVTTGEAGTLLSMDSELEVVYMLGNDVVGDGVGNGMLVVVFLTPVGRDVVCVGGGGDTTLYKCRKNCVRSSVQG